MSLFNEKDRENGPISRRHSTTTGMQKVGQRMEQLPRIILNPTGS